MKLYYVYVLASVKRTLYVGITSDLGKRVAEHRLKVHPSSFTAAYDVTRLVYYEEYTDPHQAIRREKQIKGWRRRKKVLLIETRNATWTDLAEIGALIP